MAFRTLIILILTSAFLAACGGGYEEPAPMPTRVGDDNVKIGNPYKINGVTYYPRVDNYYDVTGNASWYGSDFHGKQTANGEVYDMNQLTAAHKTLPMPSYVRVTNLSNGRSLVLRVNDRGPFVGTRVLDVSKRGAQMLGFEDKGVQRVRVQVVQPDGSPFPKMIDGGLTPVPQRTAEMDIDEQPLDIPELEEAPPSQNAIPIEESFGIFVQVASFSNENNAGLLAGQLRDIGPVVIQRANVSGNLFYRVRVGAYGVMDDALKALDKIKNLGFSDAHIFTEPST